MGGKGSKTNWKKFDHHICDESYIGKFYEHFSKVHPDGKVTKEELEGIYHAVFPEGDPTPFVKKCIHRMDRNGSMDFREFICGIGLLAYGTPEEKLRAIFRAYDLDNNGSISRWEFQSMVVAIYKGMNSVNGGRRGSHQGYLIAGDLFNRMDKNHDSKVTFDEFVEAVRQEPNIRTLLGLPSDQTC